MPAASLPLELQHAIFSYLDSRSFYAARKVCRWWRLASYDSVTLARHLQKLPIKPSVNARKIEPQELQRLFSEAARSLLLGVQISELGSAASTQALRSKTGLFGRPRIAAVTSGNKTVTINGGWLALFDTTQDPPEVLLQRPLHDMIASACQVSWLRIAPAASYALALSSDGRTLAVAQERTVQIYDLPTGPDSETVSWTVASAAGHYIKGLDFEQGDRVLRVQLSGKGVVLYLGTPESSRDAPAEPAGIEHWRSNAGLRHTFLDSSLLQLLTTAAAGAEQYQPWLGGLQLLRPFEGGYLFAAQKHGGNESSHYIYGHVRCSQPTEALPIAVEPHSFTEIAKLESFLSAWDYVKDHHGDEGMGGWDDMPSAHEHHPKSAMSEDGGLLLLAEREKKHVRHVKWTQLFLYRLPSLLRAKETVRDGETRELVRWKRLARFMDGTTVETTQDGRLGDKVEAKGPKHVVARVPLAIGTLEGEATEIKLESGKRDGAATYDITVVTEERRRQWQLVET